MLAVALLELLMQTLKVFQKHLTNELLYFQMISFLIQHIHWNKFQNEAYYLLFSG